MPILTVTGFTPPNYKIGDKSQSGQIVEFVLASTAHFIIYRTKDKTYASETSNEVVLLAAEAQAENDQLVALIYRRAPEKARDGFLLEAAQALANCFRQAGNGQAVSLKGLRDIRAAVVAARSGELRRTYIFFALKSCGFLCLAGLAALMIFANVPTLHVGYLPTLVMGGVWGAIGAMLSVLISSAKIKLSDDLVTQDNINFQGGIRILVGAIGGVLAMAAVDSNQIFPAAKGNTPALIFVCAAAGFVERMIPSLFNQMQKDKASADEE